MDWILQATKMVHWRDLVKMADIFFLFRKGTEFLGLLLVYLQSKQSPCFFFTLIAFRQGSDQDFNASFRIHTPS